MSITDLLNEHNIVLINGDDEEELVYDSPFGYGDGFIYVDATIEVWWTDIDDESRDYDELKYALSGS